MARILLVDDEESILRALEKRLRKMGHEVTPAHNGEEALVVFSPSRFDLLITDYRMPRMDGLKLIGEVLRQVEGFPIVVITGTSTDTPEVFLKAGARAHLYKPISKDDLQEALETVLSGDPR
jgi:two-component system response regulator HydG